MVARNYELKTEKDKMVFSTPSFRAEKTSVLLSGVYSKEFNSILFASAVCTLTYMAVYYSGIGSTVIRSALVLIVLIIAFLTSRKFIFKDTCLEVQFDKSNRNVNIIRHGLITRKPEVIPYAHLRSVELGSKTFAPDNIDGVDFVQKISAQHGSAVPGLSEVEEFVTLSLKLTDGSERIIFAVKINGGKVNGEPEIPVREIRGFLNS